ncbi:hypothetical protein BGZ47_002931 [Haplosporangium gracile]|nr:hypothetical protein BGZ47_002931 [Haplosporangium gracile]
MTTSTRFSLVESGYASCWSTLRKSIFLHGGIAGTPVAIYQKALFEFDTAKLAFTTINDSGELPSARTGHCLVEAYNGTKIVLFGGVNQTSAGLSDIYILDVATLKWTEGKAGGAGVGRAYAACAVTNDRFVAWGGATKINGNFVAVTASATVVYDFIQNKWITTFSPLRTNASSPDPESDPLPPTAPSGEEITSSSSSKGVLIGGIAGGVVVIVAIAVFIFFCRRHAARRKQKREKQMSFSTFAAMPVVTARTGSSSDDTFPDQQQQQQRSNTRETEKKDDEEEEKERGKGKLEDDNNGGITYVVGARAMPASPTESFFRDSGIIPQSPFHSAGEIPFPAPPVTAANVPTGYTVPVLKFFNPTAPTIPTAPTSPTTTTPSTTTPISIPSSPVASQWTSSLGFTSAAPPIPGATGVGSNPYSTFTPSPLSNAPTIGPTAGGNAYAAFTPSPLSWYSNSPEARNSLPFVPVAGNGAGGGGDLQKTGDGLVPPITPPRNPHGIQ